MPYGDRAYEHAKPRVPGKAENWTRETPPEVNDLRKQEYEKRLAIFKKKEGLQGIGDLKTSRHEFKKGDTLYSILTKEFGMNRHTAFFTMVKLLENNVNVDLWRVGDEIELKDDGSLFMKRVGTEQEIKNILEAKAVSEPQPEPAPSKAAPKEDASSAKPEADAEPTTPPPAAPAAPPERKPPPPPTPDAATETPAQPPPAAPPERGATPAAPAAPAAQTPSAPPEGRAPPERVAPAEKIPPAAPPPAAPPERGPDDIRDRSADAFKEAESGKIESKVRAMSPEEKATYEKLKKSPLWPRILSDGVKRFYRFGFQQFPITIKSSYLEIRVTGKTMRGLPRGPQILLVYLEDPQGHDPVSVDKRIKEVLDKMRSE